MRELRGWEGFPGHPYREIASNQTVLTVKYYILILKDMYRMRGEIAACSQGVGPGHHIRHSV